MKRPAAPFRHPALERYRREISRCVRCGTCRAVCPSFLPDREESLSARGRMALIEAVLDGKLRISAIFKDRLAACTGCLACEATCPSGVPVTGIIQAAKEEAVNESGPGLIHRVISAALESGRAMRSFSWLAPAALHYGARSFGAGKKPRLIPFFESSFVSASPEIIKPGRSKGRVVFFAGCAINYFQKDIGRAAVAVLAAGLGVEVLVPKAQQCCGRPMLSLGDRKAAEERAAHTNAMFQRLGADAVITACPTCGLTFKREYPTLLAPSGQRPVPVLDIHEFLAERLPEIELQAVNSRVTYHDPCHLGRGQGLSNTARDALCSVPGLTLIEMKNPDRCCGFGGVMRVNRHELSNRIADMKARDVISSGVSTVVTGCPSCRVQITDALLRAGSHVEVVHTVQVLEQALGRIHDAGCKVQENLESCIMDHAS